MRSVLCPLPSLILPPSLRLQFLIGQPFVIDPLFATEAASNPGTSGRYECFPLKGGSSLQLNELRLARLQLNIFEFAATAPQQLAVFNRIFTWRDDLLFDNDEDDPDSRPRQTCLWDNGSVAPYETPSGGGPFPLHAEAEGNYSWMLTAVPDPSELPTTNDTVDLQNLQQKTYEVSIVTFYKRDFACDASAEVPSERFVEIQFNGTGIGGGDAKLMIPTSLVSSQEKGAEYLKVKENEWIMVTAFVSEPRLDVIYGATGDGRRKVAKWYRVIRVDDEVEEDMAAATPIYFRRITLAGPDWDDTVILPSTTASATLIDGVTAVYTTTVTLP